MTILCPCPVLRSVKSAATRRFEANSSTISRCSSCELGHFNRYVPVVTCYPMATIRAPKSTPKPSLYVDRDGVDAEPHVAELERRLALVEQTLRTVVEELKARKVLPAVTVVRGPKRERMSPEAVRAQRRELLDAARKNRWKAANATTRRAREYTTVDETKRPTKKKSAKRHT